MTEITILGRGGQGGVTLAKLIATAFFKSGKFTQAFGVYAAERSGAPLQAFVRISDEQITNYNQISEPDHVIVLDRALLGPLTLDGMKSGGWIVLNTPESADALVEISAGRRVATVGATRLALQHGLGTKTVPIVNTTMFGAVARVLGLTLDDVRTALGEAKLTGANLESATTAFEQVRMLELRPAPEPILNTDEPAIVATNGAILGREQVELQASETPRIRTGSWATRRPERRELTPPCNVACPAGNDVHAFLRAMHEENFDGALSILLRTSPFPGVCGRVCPAPCMQNCNRRFLDGEVNVRELERFAAEHGTRPSAPDAPSRDEIVAVIGSGPAGLSAAYQLAKLGYPVTLFEAGRELGGLLRTGIPPYRLPREVLDNEISYILAHGVCDSRGHRIDASSLRRLSQEYAAVVVASGLQLEQTMELRTDGADVVLNGLEFLNRTRSRALELDGAKVVVVGGGNTAIDAARSALRAGATTVHILYRRTRNKMPAISEEVDAAIEEGVVLDELVAPMQLRSDALGPLLTCVRMRLGEPDESGRRRPIPETTEDAYFDVRCDRVVLALGQSADSSILNGSQPPGNIALTGFGGCPIFSCGDFANNEGTVSAAIGSGRMTASRVHHALTGSDLLSPASPTIASYDILHPALFPRMREHHGGVVPPALRRRNFREVHLGFEGEAGIRQVVEEAGRCCSCGVCNGCDRCAMHCPENIMGSQACGHSYDPVYCKGCGVCVTECPRGVLEMVAIEKE
ncbi:MAG: 2-oxoacid:acceptor oxidoreductase family protein [Planctomycetes bacterium]|nr:2-oxoacid:acceptor oxidoreductase family protein [Planctomycetota bacterium]